MVDSETSGPIDHANMLGVTPTGYGKRWLPHKFVTSFRSWASITPAFVNGTQIRIGDTRRQVALNTRTGRGQRESEGGSQLFPDQGRINSKQYATHLATASKNINPPKNVRNINVKIKKLRLSKPLVAVRIPSITFATASKTFNTATILLSLFPQHEVGTQQQHFPQHLADFAHIVPPPGLAFTGEFPGSFETFAPNPSCGCVNSIPSQTVSNCSLMQLYLF